ncbi:MAG: class I SAM-dependent methyltransferase [Planctomycetota bacterium]|nr:class I SAM-dependent methyltransferase [Planctomycetota bacterium]
MIDNLVYNLFLSKLTPLAYKQFFDLVEPKSSILDIGVGNGLMLKTLHKRVKELELTIHGVDLSEKYLKQCRKLIKKYDLTKQMRVENLDFLAADFGETKYDIVFFSQSFPLIDDKAGALEKAKAILAPGGKMIFCQTMQSDHAPVMEFIKPKLKYVSTIDFGRVTYETAYEKLLADAKLKESARHHLLKVNKDAEAMLIVVEG